MAGTSRQNDGAPGGIRREIRRSIWGVARFASFDARGMHYLNCSMTGLWRSFLAMLVALPIFFAITALSHRPTEPIHYVNIAVGYGLGWVLFPIVMVPVLLALRLEEAYVPLIVAYNWAAVIVYGLDLVTTLLAFADPRLVVSLFLAFHVVSMLYRWFVAKVALNAGVLIPLVLIVIAEVLDTFMARGLLKIFGPLPLVAIFQPS
jgi:hypothetical protein